MMLVFAHGWGFGPSLWHPLRAELGDMPGHVIDYGYFSEPSVSNSPVSPGLLSGPRIAVGHSLGALQLLQDQPSDYVGFVAINGFDRFAGPTGDATAVPRRVVDRMVRRFGEDAGQVLADFRFRCGSADPLPSLLKNDRLLKDLERLRDVDGRATAAGLNCPVLILHGTEDSILPAAMRNSVFSGCKRLERHESEGQGHLLPLTAPLWCAAHIRAFAARLGLPA